MPDAFFYIIVVSFFSVDSGVGNLKKNIEIKKNKGIYKMYFISVSMYLALKY